jgi:hypothetical protein
MTGTGVSAIELLIKQASSQAATTELKSAYVRLVGVKEITP